MFHTREKSDLLLIMETLAIRGILSNKQQQYLHHLQKGFAGEQSFDQMTTQLNDNFFILNDLFLQPHLSNAFQIDSMILTGKTLYLYEIKNYSGEYYYGEEMLVKMPVFKVSNPLIQVQNTKNKLTIFLKELRYDIEIKVYAAYVHPEFTLFNAPKYEGMLLPSQLKNHFIKIEKESKPLTAIQKKLAADLIDYQTDPMLFANDIPDYSFASLRKGIVCEECSSFDLKLHRTYYHCQSCDYENPINSALLSCIKEYQRLFPNDKLVTSILYIWCAEMLSKKRIQRTLKLLV
ncbi:nuclease-related domain-containing protein [Carnobacterium alterfunditum]|uniref:nuclease-related domain-containing protein n=1 Tax=Carnobacterium alterfunditum TaxID=28230 RepID=UPI0035935729